MRIDKAVSIPLVTHDPFFSIWSNTDKLYEKPPIHWCGAQQFLKGDITIDGKRYGFLGRKWELQPIQQQYINLTATATEYVFENDLGGIMFWELGYEARETNDLVEAIYKVFYK